MNPTTSKIGELAVLYWGQNLAAQFSNRKNPGVTFSVYTEYDSNEHGDYTYFIGEKVGSFKNIPSEFQKLIIPAAKHQKFTTVSGKIPEMVINAWKEIWGMTIEDFSGTRAYRADFEIYDQRAIDTTNAVIDIYVGIVRSCFKPYQK